MSSVVPLNNKGQSNNNASMKDMDAMQRAGMNQGRVLDKMIMLVTER